MKKMICLVAAIAVCGTVFAGPGYGPSDTGTTKWSSDAEACYRICSTLSGGEQNALWSYLDRLSLGEREAFLRSMNKASEQNGSMMYSGVVMAPGSGVAIYADESRKVNGVSYYATSYNDRCRNELSDDAAYDLLMKNGTTYERDIVGSHWWDMPEGAQHAILKIVKKAQFITAPTDEEMKRFEAHTRAM